MKITEDSLRKLIKEELSKDEQLQSINNILDALKTIDLEIDKLIGKTWESPQGSFPQTTLHKKLLASQVQLISVWQKIASVEYLLKNPPRRG